MDLYEDFERANQLIRLNRIKEAEEILVRLNSRFPGDSDVLRSLSYVRCEQEDFDNAIHFAEWAIKADPEEPMNFYQLGYGYYKKEKYKKAIENMEIAQQLNPEDADYPAMLGVIAFTQKNWNAAEQHILRALALDPENHIALKFRAKIMVKQGKKDEYKEAIYDVFNNDPEDARSFAMHGWNLIEMEDYKGAKEQFATSLRMDPMQQYAIDGMKEAIKGSSWMYAMYLKFSFWISDKKSYVQFGVFLVLYYLRKFITKYLIHHVDGNPLILFAIIAAAVFFYCFYFMEAIGVTILRLNKFGKYLLTADEKKVFSIFIVTTILILVFSGHYYVFRDSSVLYFLLVTFINGQLLTTYYLDENRDKFDSILAITSIVSGVFVVGLELLNIYGAGLLLIISLLAYLIFFLRGSRRLFF